MNRAQLMLLAALSFLLGAFVQLYHPLFTIAPTPPTGVSTRPSPSAEFGGPPYDFTFDTGQLGGQDFSPKLVAAIETREWIFWDAGRAVDPTPQVDVRMMSTDGKRLFFIFGARRPEWHGFHRTVRGAKVKLAFVPHPAGGLMVVPKVQKAAP